MKTILPERSPKQITYFPAIDGLRAIAVLFVLFHHFFRQDIAEKFLLGNVGVDVFFTLSGFLITGILLTYKEQLNFKAAIKKFYWRRTLRIFPVYFLYLVIALILFKSMFTWASLLSATFYLTNFYAIYVQPLPWQLGHFWSLAVEEQFYLCWPFFILLTPTKHIKPLTLAIVIGGILFPIAHTIIFSVSLVEYMHTLSCISCLGLGGLLAIYQKQQSPILDYIKEYNLTLVLFFASLSGICIAFVHVPIALDLIRPCNGALTFCLLVRITSMSLTGGWGILESVKLQLIGRISYGIYVYHVLVVMVCRDFFRNAFPGWTYDLLAVPILSSITILTAYISFEFFEKRILSLKDYAPLEKHQKPIHLNPQGLNKQQVHPAEAHFGNYDTTQEMMEQRVSVGIIPSRSPF